MSSEMEPITRIESTKTFEKQVLKVPEFIRAKVGLWIFLVESRGIHEVMKSPGFHDEPLKGSRKGQRSVRLNRAYRLIYEVVRDRVHVRLLEVHKHDY
jgi:proteic killer suppression protein